MARVKLRRDLPEQSHRIRVRSGVELSRKRTARDDGDGEKEPNRAGLPEPEARTAWAWDHEMTRSSTSTENGRGHVARRVALHLCRSRPSGEMILF